MSKILSNLKKIFLRDPLDLIVFLLAIFAFTCWVVTRTVYFENHEINIKTLINIGGAFFPVIGYVFYVMYRFAVYKEKMKKYITDPEGRKELKLDE